LYKVITGKLQLQITTEVIKLVI